MALQLGGMSADSVYDEITKQGISQADALKIIGEWFVQTGTYSPRMFTYTPAPLAASDPDCTSTFAQTFFHSDWIDGVSVVQAGKTAGENGFNDRLHRIEHDLGALGTNMAEAFTCLGELRSEVSGLLGEVAAELNRIDSDLGQLFSMVNDLTDQVGRNTGGLLTKATFAGTTKIFGQDVSVWNTTAGMLTLPTVQTFATDAVGNPQVSDPASFAKFAADPGVAAAFGGAVTPGDIVQNYGTQVLDNGRTVANALQVLPQDTSYQSLTDLTNALNQANATVIRATGTQQVAVAGSFSDLGSGITDVSQASVGRLNVVPTNAGTALAAAGIDTVGKLASASPATVSEQLAAAGVQATAGEVASWVGTAQTLNQIGSVA